MDSARFTDDFHTRPKSRALFESVRARILEGHHAPGQWLKQADLEAEYGATRSEVRAVLSTLAERGIVEYVKNRGFRVYERTAEEISEISDMIVALEIASAPKIIENALPENIDELRGFADAFGALIQNGSQSDLRIANYRFHGALIALGGNKLITRTVCNLRECCAGGPEAKYATYEGLQTSNREHHEIIEALSAKNVSLLVQLLTIHAIQDAR